VRMDISRIDQLIASGEFARQPLLLEAMDRGRARQLHLLGLVSDGGVHSHIEHLFALLRMARENKVERVFVHCFMDGRDTPPNSGIDFLRQLERKMREYGVGQIATVIGRYYAMDRDNRWERIEKAYRAMVHGDAEAKFSDPFAAVRASYEKGVTDEFIVPAVITTEAAPGKPAVPRGLIRDNDAIIFFNFRADRACFELERNLVEIARRRADCSGDCGKNAPPPIAAVATRNKRASCCRGGEAAMSSRTRLSRPARLAVLSTERSV